jgi:predicted ATPase/DNA-binding SARP family transcriptional activator
MLPGEPSGVVFCVLGPLRVEGPHREVRIGGTRRRGVLLRLLASPGRPVPVDVLAEDVWDGDPPTAAASTLQSHVSALRQAVGPGRLGFGEGGYRLAVGPGELDSLMFEADVATGRAAISAGDFGSAADSLDRALARWRGEAFADVAGASWSVLVAGHLDEMRKLAVEEALEAHLASGHHHEVCGLAGEAVAAEPLRERRWAALMLALYRAGRQADAVAAYRRLRATLADQLGLDPSPQLARLEHDILTQSPDLDWADATGARLVDIPAVSANTPASRSNLPSPVGRFIGRQAELAELRKLVARERLVTITGTGGAGKTRLAIEIAGAHLDDYRDGVWFADLAKLSDPAGVAGALADAIGARQASDEPAEQLLIGRVTGMQALLVVDNCEHLIDPVATTVERVLEASPEMRVVATSRQPLRVPGERPWHTPPIQFPANDLRDAAELVSFDAVRLFLDRAHELEDVSPAELQVIAKITARLEGIPLAIELAAAQTAQLGLQRLASELDDRLGVSWLRSRSSRIRQQTLAATIGWSYELLAPQLQATLKRMAVFAGGFTVDAATAVTAPATNVAQTVAALAERSLIEPVRPDWPRRHPARYRMLETIRQYCIDRAADDDPQEDKAARDAHSQYFAALARQGSASLTGWHQGRWFATLESDHANLTTAINHLLSQPGRGSEAMQMTVDLARFWLDKQSIEGADLARRSLETMDQSISTTLRCAALNLAGLVIMRQDNEAARAYLTESLRVARSIHDDFHQAAALRGLAYLFSVAEDQERASASAQTAVHLARSAGDLVLLGECLRCLGLCMADNPARKAVYREALAVTYRAGDRLTTAWTHNDLGFLALIADDLETARHHYERAQEIFHEVGHSNLVLGAYLGWVHLRAGSLDAANSTFAQALREDELSSDPINSRYMILALACVAAARREWERAACLIGFADSEVEDGGPPWHELERRYREEALADVQRQLGTQFQKYYDSGRTGERGDLIHLALGQGHSLT